MYLPEDKSGAIYIVGNSDESIDISSTIKQDDVIVRFNSLNRTSNLRPDVLFIANSSSMILGGEILNSVRILDKSPIVVWRYRVSDILLNRYEEVSISKKIKYFFKFKVFIQKNTLSNLNQCYISEKVHNKSIEMLGKLPSTGFMAILLYLNLYPEREIYIHNFNFEGWDGHNWDAEKEYITQMIKNGYLKLATI